MVNGEFVIKKGVKRMKLSFKQVNNILIVRLEGEFDLHTVDSFKDAVEKKINSKVKNIILNLKQIKFIDSSGLGAILGLYKRVTARGGKIVMANATPQLKRIFELSGILKIMKISKNEEDALDLIVEGARR